MFSTTFEPAQRLTLECFVAMKVALAREGELHEGLMACDLLPLPPELAPGWYSPTADGTRFVGWWPV